MLSLCHNNMNHPSHFLFVSLNGRLSECSSVLKDYEIIIHYINCALRSLEGPSPPPRASRASSHSDLHSMKFDKIWQVSSYSHTCFLLLISASKLPLPNDNEHHEITKKHIRIENGKGQKKRRKSYEIQKCPLWWKEKWRLVEIWIYPDFQTW